MDITVNIHTSVNIIVAFLWFFSAEDTWRETARWFQSLASWQTQTIPKNKCSLLLCRNSVLTSALSWSTHCPTPLLDVVPKAAFQWQIFHQEFADWPSTLFQKTWAHFKLHLPVAVVPPFLWKESFLVAFLLIPETETIQRSCCFCFPHAKSNRVFSI